MPSEDYWKAHPKRRDRRCMAACPQYFGSGLRRCRNYKTKGQHCHIHQPPLKYRTEAMWACEEHGCDHGCVVWLDGKTALSVGQEHTEKTGHLVKILIRPEPERD